VQPGQLILIAGALLAAGVIASLLADRVGFPALLLLLGLGMAVGSDGAGWIEFGNEPDDFELALLLGTIALAVILFEAGLAAGFAELRPVLRPSIALAGVGTTGTAAVTGVACVWLLDVSFLEGMLIGATIAASDGAAVFAVLRGSNLRRRLARTLVGEAGLNDPVAVLLVLALIELIINPGAGLDDVLVLFAQELAIGTAVGLGVGWLVVQAMRRVPSARAGLQLVASVTGAALAFGAADVLHGSGFLAVFLAGLIFGSTDVPTRGPVRAFHEGLSTVAEIALFFTLGLLVVPTQLDDVLLDGTLVALIVAFVARPLAATIATSQDPYSARERLLLGWAGLRGAVPVVLATFPVIAGVPRSLEFFNIAFFAVLLSTLIQGTTVEPLARRLGLTEPQRVTAAST
jgi:cell volume regulation protein A